MVKRLKFAFLILVGACVICGCASNPTQKAALLLVDQLEIYQASVGEKVKAERAFYQDIRSMLDKSAARQAWVHQQVETRNRITGLTDQAIVQDKGLQVSALQQFLREENDFARERKSAEAQRRAKIESNYRVSFDSLTQKLRELSVTRSKLLALSQDRAVADHLFERVQEAAALAIRLEEEARANETNKGE